MKKKMLFGFLCCLTSFYNAIAQPVFNKEIEIKEGISRQKVEKLRSWAISNYGAGKARIAQNQIITEGNFEVYSTNFFGKTTQVCFYNLIMEVNDNTLSLKLENIYFGNFRRPMHKGDRGGWSYKSFESMYPPEEKAGLEKKAYKAYTDQAIQYFNNLFQEIETEISG